MGERLRGTASGWSSSGVEASVWFMTPSKFHQENQKPQTWAIPRKQTVPGPGIPWSSPHLRIPSGQRLPATWETSQVALSHWTFLSHLPSPAAVLMHTKCGWMEAHCLLLRGGDAWFWRRGTACTEQPVVRSQSSLLEMRAPSPALLPVNAGQALGENPATICSAHLVWGEPGKSKREHINKAKTGNLHFLIQSIFEGWEIGTGERARTQKKGCLGMIR